MKFSYNLLTTTHLGDAYLKYLASIYLFVTFPTLPEGSLHVARQRIISNRSLLRNANRCDIPQYIQIRSFSLKDWSPPNYIYYEPPKSSARESAENDVGNEGEDGDPTCPPSEPPADVCNSDK